jgi:hypothetical protein
MGGVDDKITLKRILLNEKDVMATATLQVRQAVASIKAK